MPKCQVSSRRQPHKTKAQADDKLHEKSWSEQVKTLDLWDEWKAKATANGMAPSVSGFERQHGLQRNGLTRLLQRREMVEALYKLYPNATAVERSRITHRPFAPVEFILNDWVIYFRKRHIPINTTMLVLLAKEIYRQWVTLYGPLFDARGNPPTWSKDWARRFKDSWKLLYFKMVGEAASISWDDIKDEVQQISAKLEEYDLEDIYNCDETGLYLKWLSNWTLDVIKVSGVKPRSADRVSVLFCTNATGTDKRKPFILSLHRPCDLHPMTKTQVEMQPNHEARVAYMQKFVFSGWLQRFQDSITSKSPNRKILLLLDSAPGHLIIGDPDFRNKYPNIDVVTLPKNSTALTQPLDAGIIAVFKRYYQDFLAISTLLHRHRTNKSSGYISNGLAWKHIVQAWVMVKADTIRHCFRHVPFFSDRQRQLLSKTNEKDREVEIAINRIRSSVAGHNRAPPFEFVAGSSDAEIERHLEAQPETPVVLCPDSRERWQELENPEEAPVPNKAVQNNQDIVTGSTGCIDHTQLALATAPMQVATVYNALPKDHQDALMSHADTPRRYFGRISRELDASSFVSRKLEGIHENTALARYLPPILRQSELDLSSMDNDESDDADDPDYHYPIPEGIPATPHSKRVGRGRNSRRVTYQVLDAPSTGSSAFSGSVYSPLCAGSVSGEGTKGKLDFRDLTSDETKRKESVLREALEIMSTHKIFGERTQKEMINNLELAVDCAAKTTKSYYLDLISQRTAQRAKEIEEFERHYETIDSLHGYASDCDNHNSDSDSSFRITPGCTPTKPRVQMSYGSTQDQNAMDENAMEEEGVEEEGVEEEGVEEERVEEERVEEEGMEEEGVEEEGVEEEEEDEEPLQRRRRERCNEDE